MVENPRVWKCAQEEIDTVIGIDRLPEFDDRHSLPYVDAIVRESFRWKPVGPLGACSGILEAFLNWPKAFRMPISRATYTRVTISQKASCM